MGSNSLGGTGSGGYNAALGYQSLYALTSGSYNTSYGASSSDALTTGSSNVTIGYNSEAGTVNATNQIVIGSGSTGQADNSVTLGNASITAVYAAQDAGATIYAAALDVSASGGITLENDETITNSTDGTVEIGGNLSGTGSISGFDTNLNDITSGDLTGNAYTLVATDNGKVVTIDNSTTDATITIPVGLGDGFNCLIVQKGNHQTTISHASGSSNIVNRSGETKTNARYAVVSIINIGSELYIVSGDTGS